MNKTEYLDGLFLAASGGDESAYEELSNEFLSFGKCIAIEILTKCNISKCNLDDLVCCIGEIFMYTINSYDPTKNSFLGYSSYVLRRRLYRYIEFDKIKEFSDLVSLDTISEDGVLLYEKIEDKSINAISDKVAVDRFKYEISSPRHVDTKLVKLGKSICGLEMSGYSLKEICLLLNISEHQVRYAKEQFINSKFAQNLKLELK